METDNTTDNNITDHNTIDNISGDSINREDLNADGMNTNEMNTEDLPSNSQNGEAQKQQAKNMEAKKVASLPLSNTASQTTKKEKIPLQTRLQKEQSATRAISRKRKLILYTFAALGLSLTVIYFYGRIRSLIDQSHTGARLPGNLIRIDSSDRKIDPLTQSYEKQAKNHYQDSLHRAIEKDALSHISMDWGRLYDVDKYDLDRDVKNKQQAEGSGKDTLSPYSEKSLYDMLTRDRLEMDKVAMDRASNDSLPTSGRLASRQEVQIQKKTVALKKAIAKSTARRAATKRFDATLATSGVRSASQNSLFNVVHGSADSPNDTYSGDNSNGNSSDSNGSDGNSSDNAASTKNIIVRAVVHGNHKVKTGSKVAFRLLEPVTFHGNQFEKNTILIGIATFSNGRVTFSDFRSKSLSAVSASHGAVASTALPLLCYDTDMVAGISVSDQSPVETQTRQAGSSALADAANDASYSIPYGSLARAASSLTRGVANGKRQAREMFIDLADNYPVLLELMPPRSK